MRWDAVELARFCRDAGMGRDDVVTATALALAVSGGIDSYDYRPGAPGSGRYVGLWGIDTDRWPEYRSWTLQSPTEAARAARELTEAVGSWAWSPAYAGGAHVAHLEHAGVEASKYQGTQRASGEIGTVTFRRQVRESLDRAAQARRMLPPVRNLRGQP